MKKTSIIIPSLFLLLINTFSVAAQSNFFSDLSENIVAKNKQRTIVTAQYRTTKLDLASMRSFLWALPSEKKVLTGPSLVSLLTLPMPDGTNARFRVWESSIQEPELEAKFPEIKTFAGQGIDDPYASIRFDLTDLGFHAQIISHATGNIYIDPYARGDVHNYISYFSKDNIRQTNFSCFNKPENTHGVVGTSSLVPVGACRGTQLYTYRIAVACTGEYAVAVGATTPAMLHSAIVTTMNRVNGIYESEVAIRLVLVANNNTIEFLDSLTDPFTGNINADILIEESQNVCTNKIGSANFDIGHTFSTGAGGLAGLGVICKNDSKGRGVTGSDSPVGDSYDIDYVAHEIGHQFGGEHPLNGVSGQCSDNRVDITAYEVGSGSTIQAYASICAEDDLQPNANAYFHSVSFDQISAYVEGDGSSCKVSSATGNNIPVITAMNNNGVTIPIKTPFTLSGAATDIDGDALTYNWEEWDLGPATTWSGGASNATSPIFRSRLPKTTGERTFPAIEVILAGYPANPAATMNGLKGETLPQVPRSMKFRFTVRDNKAAGGGVVTGGQGCGTFNTPFTINVAGSSPFLVTSPNGGQSYEQGSMQTVTWDAAGTLASPFNVANVKITLSTDGGLTYPHVLSNSTPNTGTATVTMPSSISTNTARIKVEALNNIFFDISDANFIVATVLPLNLLSFDAIKVGNNVKIFWTISQEANTKYFSVQHSFDGNSFGEIGKISALGNAGNNNNSYDLLHEDLEYRDHYYRLTIVGIDGRLSYSNVVMVKNEQVGQNNMMAVYPSPMRSGVNKIKVSFTASTSKMVDLNITDMLGRVVLKQQNYVLQGNNHIVVKGVQRLGAGMYIVSVNDGHAVQPAKFHIVR